MEKITQAEIEQDMIDLREFMVNADLFTVTIGDCAMYFHCSEQTVRNRLFRGGTNWDKIKRDERIRRVESLRTDPGASASDFAEACGYWDNSTFYRAFKSWVGLSFRQWRAAA